MKISIPNNEPFVCARKRKKKRSLLGNERKCGWFALDRRPSSLRLFFLSREEQTEFYRQFYRYGQATPGRAGTALAPRDGQLDNRPYPNFLLLAHFHIRRVVFLPGAGRRTASKSARGPTFWTHTQLTAHLPQTKHPVCVSSHFRVYVRNTNQCHSDVTPSFEYSQREMDRDSLF